MEEELGIPAEKAEVRTMKYTYTEVGCHFIHIVSYQSILFIYLFIDQLMKLLIWNFCNLFIFPNLYHFSVNLPICIE